MSKSHSSMDRRRAIRVIGAGGLGAVVAACGGGGSGRSGNQVNVDDVANAAFDVTGFDFVAGFRPVSRTAYEQVRAYDTGVIVATRDLSAHLDASGNSFFRMGVAHTDGTLDQYIAVTKFAPALLIAPPLPPLVGQSQNILPGTIFKTVDRSGAPAERLYELKDIEYDLDLSAAGVADVTLPHELFMTSSDPNHSAANIERSRFYFVNHSELDPTTGLAREFVIELTRTGTGGNNISSGGTNHNYDGTDSNLPYAFKWNLDKPQPQRTGLQLDQNASGGLATGATPAARKVLGPLLRGVLLDDDPNDEIAGQELTRNGLFDTTHFQPHPAGVVDGAALLYEKRLEVGSVIATPQYRFENGVLTLGFKDPLNNTQLGGRVGFLSTDDSVKVITSQSPHGNPDVQIYLKQ